MRPHTSEPATTVSAADEGRGSAAAGGIRQPLAWRPVTAIAVALTLILLAANGGYGYHRDELYFRLLGRTPDWGYVDQPPLTPMLAWLSTRVFGDTVWGLRVPAALAAAGFVLLAALITAELGGRRGAQILTAAGTAISAFTVIAGHTLNTSTVDLLVWEAVILFACRALLRGEGYWWLPAGVVAGLGLYNKHLVVLLAIGLAVGLLAIGPRRVLLDRWLWAGAVIGLILGAPNIVFQVVNDWPQLKMAEAIDRTDGTENRILYVPMQFLLLGPTLAPIWIAGLFNVFRLREWRPIRAVALAYPVIGVLVVLSGGQFYYALGLLLFLLAAGCVVIERWWAPGSARRAVVVAALAVNAAIVAVIALPVIPLGSLGATPIPDVNEVARESVGWPQLAAQVSEVYAALPAEDRARAVLFTGNYGEAGALDRYGPRHGLPKVYSGHNQLFFRARPPDTATVVIAVGVRPGVLDSLFGSCVLARQIDNGYGVENEERGARITVCRQPREPWSRIWPRTLHYS